MKLCSKPWNPAYSTIYYLSKSNKEWKTRSTPSTVRHLRELKLSYKIHPRNKPSDQPYTDPIPPWQLFSIPVELFPMSKTAAKQNTHLTSATFRAINKDEPPDHLSIYTDGSTCMTSRKSTCAFFIHKLKIKESFLLSESTNSFNVELEAINQALAHVYHQDWNMITIYCDSKAAIEAIRNFKWTASNTIPKIINQIVNFNSAGPKIKFYWIPRHSGIQGNATAYNLANAGRHTNVGHQLSHCPNVAERLLKMQVLTRLKTISTNTGVINRQRMGMCPWHTHKRRKIQTALFRLRSGHCKLNNTLSKSDMDINPECLHGCEEKEDTTHILLHCPHYSNARTQLTNALLKNNVSLPLDIPTLMGCNPNIPKHTQGAIAKQLVTILIETQLIERI
ncbi:Uncharacterized protein APZ42_025892 [Daphnia magna]|uniref:RNase H type-1 domain-containing protein n=1 Tax=Daphnia magna TaxID=35525 RepID=A0A164SNJ5_9CRUS|nr:Uncharacterized protein APZ42_025892 [Daphnia magna]